MNAVLFALIAAGFVAVNLLRGGARMAFSLPSYGILAVAACLSVVCLRRVSLGQASRFCLGATTLCFGYFLVRTALSPEEYLARYNLYLAAAALCVYLLVLLYVTDAKLRGGLVAVLLALGVANCAIGAIQFFKEHGFMPFPLEARSPGYGPRATGFFLVPNSLAGFLEICALMGLSMVWWSRWSVYAKIVAGYAVVVSLGGILLTGSRGGYLSTFCGLVVFACLSAYAGVHRLRDRAGVVFVGAACLALLVGWGVKQSIDGSYLLRDRASTMSMEAGDTRLYLWKSAMQQFSLSPIVGTGSGTYRYFARQFRSPFVQSDPRLTHNDYLQLLAEYGIIGVVGMAIVFLEHIRNGLVSLVRANTAHSRIVDIHSNTLALTIGSLSALSAYLVHSALDFNFHVPANALVMAALFGILARSGREPQDAPSTGKRILDRAYGVLLPGLGVWLAVGALPTFPAEYLKEKAIYNDAHWVPEETDRMMEQWLRQGLKWDPRNPELYTWLGRTISSQGTWSDDPVAGQRLHAEAIAPFQRALELAPQDVLAVLDLAGALDAVSRFSDAEKYYQRAMELDPNSSLVHCALGSHLELQGQFASAEEHYQYAIDHYFSSARSTLEAMRKRQGLTGKP